MNDTLLVVSPHPDDETLGAGGSILKYKQCGSKVVWLNFTDMQAAYGYKETAVSARTAEIKEVVGLYGFDDFINLRLRPAGLAEYPRNELVKYVIDVVRAVKPNTVIFPFKNDIHSDHRVVYETVYSAVKTFRAPDVKRIFMMEILSETDFASFDSGFIPNYFIDISDFLETKLQIMSIYQSEVGPPPFPRSLENIKALATLRGAMAGCRYAESFILLKGIE